MVVGLTYQHHPLLIKPFEFQYQHYRVRMVVGLIVALVSVQEHHGFLTFIADELPNKMRSLVLFSSNNTDHILLG